MAAGFTVNAVIVRLDSAFVQGSRVDFTGTDILRIAGGVFAEFWLNSDVHVMAAQLGMTA